MAVNRIQKELREFYRDSPADISVEPDSQDIFHWTVTINGPPDTPYENGVFYLDVRFPPDYPNSHPNIIFKNRIFHPNITPRGVICIEMLCCEWKPTLTVANAISKIKSLMIEPDISGSHYPVYKILKLYKDDRAEYDKTAREWTQLYAT